MKITKNEIRRHYDKLRKIYGHFGLSVVNDVMAIQRLDVLDKTLHRHATMACNVPLSETQTRHHERFELEAIAEVETMLPKLKGKIFVNGDPRGFALKIHDEHRGDLIYESGVHRDWGGYGCLSPSAQLGGE